MDLRTTLRRYWHLFLNRKDDQSPHYKWLKADGDRTLRLDYPLNSDSVVFDMGGYEGAWAEDMHKRYDSNVYVFEPVPSFFEKIKEKFRGNDKVRVYCFGLSKNDSTESIGLSADGSSVFVPTDEMIDIQLKKGSDFMGKENISHIDLIKLNIEGGEYDLLEHLIETGFVKNIGNIQVQFHHIPDSDMRMKNIQEKLSATHVPTYQFPYVWENWKLR